VHAPAAQPPSAAADTDDAPQTPDPFEQPDDAPVDSKLLLEQMRHDCCTELPASEVEKHRAR